MTILIDGRARYVIQCLRDDELEPAEPTDVEKRDAFIGVWRRAETDWQKPRAPFGSPEYALAQRLASTHTLDKLKRSMVHWYMHSYEPVRREGKHPLLWFAHCLPTILKELP